jgi:hypothetical protein
MEAVYWPVGRFHFRRDWHKTGKEHGQCTIIFQRLSFTTVYGKNTVVYERKCSVCGLRISPYTATEISDHNTGSCNTAKYDRIPSVNNMYTVVYGVVNGCKQPYTESLTIDLGFLAIYSCSTTSCFSF